MNADLLDAPAIPGAGLAGTVNRAALQRAIASVAPAAAAKSSLVVLGAVHLRATDGRLQATATNLDTWIRASMDAQVSGEGEIAIPAPLLRDCVDRMPGEAVTIRDTARRTTLKSGTARATLNGYAADEYPVMPTVIYGEARLPWPVLSAAMKRVLWSASSEAARPILNGLSWRSAKGVTKLCATSGHALALATLPIETPIADAIIPATTLALALKLFQGEQEVEVGWGGAHEGHVNYIGFRSDDAEILIRLIDGPFPEYEQVIPSGGQPRSARVSVAALSGAARRVSVCASIASRRISLTFEGDACKVAASASDVGSAFDAIAASGWEGDALEIGFSRDYLLAVLANAASDDVDLAIRSERGAGVFTPATPSPDFTWLGLVMPLRLIA